MQKIKFLPAFSGVAVKSAVVRRAGCAVLLTLGALTNKPAVADYVIRVTGQVEEKPGGEHPPTLSLRFKYKGSEVKASIDGIPLYRTDEGKFEFKLSQAMVNEVLLNKEVNRNLPKNSLYTDWAAASMQFHYTDPDGDRITQHVVSCDPGLSRIGVSFSGGGASLQQLDCSL
jgi:hypothetical protein